jgi:hypothetical protein
MIRPYSALLFFILFASPALGYPGVPLCDPSSKFGTIAIQFGHLKLIVSDPGHSKHETCSFRVVSDDGRALANDEHLGILQPEYVDLDRDGIPELIVAADSGGSGAYHDSFVFSQSGRPRLVQSIKNSYPLHAVYDFRSNQGYALETGDLVFNSFEGLCNGCSPRPAIYLKLENGRLSDVSGHFKAEYDREIAKTRRDINNDDLKRFVKATSRDNDGYVSTVGPREAVLKIILDYLYSGREEQARAAVTEMWPGFDRDRVWKEIRKTRATGILEQISH